MDKTQYRKSIEAGFPLRDSHCQIFRRLIGNLANTWHNPGFFQSSYGCARSFQGRLVGRVLKFDFCDSNKWSYLNNIGKIIGMTCEIIY